MQLLLAGPAQHALDERLAADLWVLCETTQMPYRTFGCAQAGILTTFTLPGTVFASVE